MNPKQTPPFVGWAMDAYPTATDEYHLSILERQINSGANYVWIGHNNPGWVEKNKVEPALSYAIFEEALDPEAPDHEIAKEILDAQFRFLNLCKEMEIPVVFPIGYQIQMGKWWISRNPEHLRVDWDGNVLDWGGVSASHFSPVYQEDIKRYYKWVVENFINPYKEIIQLVNLADEPFGGDYSSHAEKEFKNRYGFGFREVGDDVERQRALGQFQSDVIVDYAVWSANAWYEVCPDIPSTMSFCGFHGREENTMPTVVNLFKKTPPSFDITFDLYPRDGLPQNKIAKVDITSLWIFLIQLGCLSKKYNKNLWFWPTGNSWGTGQDSPDKGYISDAMVNQIYCADLMAAVGGKVKGLGIWNLNVYCQGLYNDIYETTYNPDEMFERLSETFAFVYPAMKNSLESSLEVEPKFAIYAPPEPGYLRIGKSKVPVSRLGEPETRPYDFTALEAITHQGVPYSVVDEISECPVMIALPETTEELLPTQREDLKNWLKEDRILLIGKKLASLFDVKVEEEIELLEINGGKLLIADLSTFFLMKNRELFEKYWLMIFQKDEISPVYYYKTPWRELWYNLNGENQAFPTHSKCKFFNRNGQIGPPSADSLEHHAFAVSEAE